MKTPEISSSTTPRKRRNICIGVGAFFLFLFLLLLILGLTVYRPRHAVTTVNSVRLAGLRTGFNVPALGVDLNATLVLDLSVTNPNRAGFRYPDGGSTELYYRGGLVGQAAIPPGDIGAGETVRMNVTVTVLAGRLISNSDVYADVISGTLLMTTYTTIAGRVTILGVINCHVVTYTTCDVTINVSSGTVANSDCKYKTKL